MKSRLYEPREPEWGDLTTVFRDRPVVICPTCGQNDRLTVFWRGDSYKIQDAWLHCIRCKIIFEPPEDWVSKGNEK